MDFWASRFLLKACLSSWTKPAAAPAPRETREDDDTPRPVGRGRESAGEALVKSVLRAAGSQIGRQIVRGILGSLLGGRR